MRKLISLLLTAAICTLLVSTTSAADSAPDYPQEWNGTARLRGGNTYTVSERITVGGSITVPAGAELRIVNGGELVFTTGARIDHRGTIHTEQGGRLFVSGRLTSRSGSRTEIYGEMLGSLNSRIDTAGFMSVNNHGDFRTSGVFNLHKGAQLQNSGAVRLLSSGRGTFSGTYTDTGSAALLRVAGELGVSLSGRLYINNALTVPAKGRLLNSGLVTLEDSSVFTRTGVFRNTRSGRLTDNTPPPHLDRFWFTAEAIHREPEVIMHGIDVSRWQETVDWEKVAAAGVEFVMMRAAVGAFTNRAGDSFPDSEDRRFREYIAGAQANGIEVGVYMYSYAKTVPQIQREARFLVNLLREFEITYPVVLDMEEPRSYYTDCPSAMAAAFLEIITEAGYFPMMYSYKSWLENNLTPDVRDTYAVWVAHIDVPATTYRYNYVMWQYTFTGSVSGIAGDVDLNIGYRDFAAYIRRTGLNRL
jgi:GH25 family lysozyme M1 (1,4-beta-N-acetylmuramidase)